MNKAWRETLIQQAVNNMTEQKAEMLDNCPWGYCIIDDQGTSVEINDKGALMFGLTREDLVSHKIDNWPPYQIAKILRDRVNIQTEVTVFVQYQLKILLINAFPIVTDFGESGAMAWFIDITEQREMILHLQHMDRLSTVGEMTSVIAHNIRNPLAAMKSMVQMGQMAPKQVDFANMLAKLDNHIANIDSHLGRILTFCRPTTETTQSCSLTFILENVITMLGSKIAYNNIILEKHIIKPDPIIEINLLDFQHVLLNLINNAIDAISGSGKICIHMDVIDNKVHISISDTGQGISTENLPMIWNMFLPPSLKEPV